MMRIVHTTWPFDSNGSSFNFFSMIGVGEVGRLLFATIGSWSGGIGSVGSYNEDNYDEDGGDDGDDDDYLGGKVL